MPPVPVIQIPVKGLKKVGNIDLTNRPKVWNEDEKAWSTVLSTSFGTDEGEVLVPRVVKGQILSEQDAQDHYHKTGEHLGVFDTPDNANAYAEALHRSEAARIGKRDVESWIAGKSR